PGEQLLIRIAVNYGDCLIEEHDVFGEVVNIAGKLLSCCEARQIVIDATCYHAVKNAADVTITPLAVSKELGQVIAFPVYSIAWEAARETAQPGICIFSLSAERKARGNASAEDVEKITALVRQHAARIIHADETWLHATFGTFQAGLDTAARAMQQYLGGLSEGEALSHDLKIGLHLIDEKYGDDENFRNYFHETEAACASAEPYDIIITEPLYLRLPPEFHKSCREKRGQGDTQKKYYLFRPVPAGREASAFASFIPDDAIDPRAVACFYCGMTLHPAHSCPSKLIRDSRNAVEKLSYVPLHQIRSIFEDYFSEYVRPLQGNADGARYERLFTADPDDPYALGFFSFYEIAAVFQLRSIHQLYLDHPPQHASASGNTGALAVGRDCLRVSKSDEADEWFEKALKENPNDYRPFIDMGLLSIERAEPSRAIANLRKAFSCATKDEQKNYISLLSARIYEISGALVNAKEEMQKVLQGSPSWREGQYYYAVLLAKMKNAEAAIDIFKKLLESSDRYYLLMSLDPELQMLRKEIDALLNRELTAMRTKGQESFEAMKKVVEDFKLWFSREDEEYMTAAGILRKAAGYMQDECVAGLLDLPGLEADVTLLFRHALDKRRNALEEKLARHKKMYDAFAACLEKFPYKSAITPDDSKLKKNFKASLENVLKNISASSPDKLRDARAGIEKLTLTAEELLSCQQRLDIIKNLYFALECSWKMLCFFVIASLSTACIVALSLTLYSCIVGSFSAITMSDVLSHLRYGFIVGFFSGLLGTGIWFKKNFRDLYGKMES
ncbi:MAG: hypothetical protein WCQ99_08745, partial [Pseudomonadota bacterium]